MRLVCRALWLLLLLVSAASSYAQVTTTKVVPDVWEVTLEPEASVERAFGVETGATPIQAVDVVFAIDRTSSMSGEIASVKTNAAAILQGIRSLIADSRFAVVSFMDYPASYSYPGYSAQYGSGGDVPWQVNQDLTANLASITAAINSLTLGNGQDGPECYTRVLYEAARLPWREGAKKIVILFGDAPTHDLTFAGFNYGGDPGRDATARTADDLVYATVVDELREKGITVLAVNSGDEYYAGPTFKGASMGFGDLRGTNGQYVLLQNASQIPAIVDDLMTTEALTVHTLKLEAASPYDTWLTVSPASRSEVHANESVDFQVTLEVPGGTAPGQYVFALRAVGDGSFLAHATVIVTVPPTFSSADTLFRPDPDAFNFDNRTLPQSWNMFRQFFGPADVEYANGEHRYDADLYFTNDYSRAGQGGSCYGFSAASILSYFATPQPNAGPFAMPGVEDLHETGTLAAHSNSIAYYQASQMSMTRRLIVEESEKGTPSDVYRAVRGAIGTGRSGLIGIRGSRGRHALAPYRLEESGDTARLYVYDSNAPGEDDRLIEFDLGADTWSYGSAWGGAAGDQSIRFAPFSILLDKGVPIWRYESPVPPHTAVTAVGSGGITLAAPDSSEPPEGAMDMTVEAADDPGSPVRAWAVPAEHDYLATYEAEAAGSVGPCPS